MLAKGRVVIVDDDEDDLEAVQRLLIEHGCQDLVTMLEPKQFLADLDELKPDLAIFDLKMGPPDGMDLLRCLKSRYANTLCPAIVLSGSNNPKAREAALSLGAADVILKPFPPLELVLKINNLLELRSLTSRLERRVVERTAEIQRSRDELLFRLSLVSEVRDQHTSEHSKRMVSLVIAVAQELGINAEEAAIWGRAASLHDIGKLGVPEAILLKPGSLTSEEFAIVKRHTEIGAQLLAGSPVRLMQIAETIARFHHERWNGTGYLGLRGEEIPLCARVVAVVDVYDALLSERPYKVAWTAEAALAEIRVNAGLHFDPHVVSAFERAIGQRDGGCISAEISAQLDQLERAETALRTAMG